MTEQNHDSVITYFDYRRLQGLLQLYRERSTVEPWSLDALQRGLAHARTVPSHSVPADVITMNSRAVLRDLATGEDLCVTLVFPDVAVSDGRAVPVLSPLGLALLSCRVGQVLNLSSASGAKQVRIEKVTYQPEASGNFLM